MPGTKVCKICGKEYPYCRTILPQGINRWQDVACCPEHAEEYFALIAASRAEDSDVTADKTALAADESAADAAPLTTEKTPTVSNGIPYKAVDTKVNTRKPKRLPYQKA